MNNVLSLQLKNNFPSLFSKLESVDCGDGWYDLIESMSYVILQSINELPIELRNDIYFTTIKQKFGYLRIYVHHGTPVIDAILLIGELLSCKLCEQCGDKGKLNRTGSISSSCERHAKK